MKNFTFLTSFKSRRNPERLVILSYTGLYWKHFIPCSLGTGMTVVHSHGVMQGFQERTRGGGRGCWGVGGLFAARRKVFQFCNIWSGCSQPCWLNARPNHMHMHQNFKADCPGSPCREGTTQWSSLGCPKLSLVHTWRTLDGDPFHHLLSSFFFNWSYGFYSFFFFFLFLFLSMLKSRSPGRQPVFKPVQYSNSTHGYPGSWFSDAQ